jgi:hypothetical protein
VKSWSVLILLSVILLSVIPTVLVCQTQPVHHGIENLYILSDAKSRSVSPENITGEKGKGGMTPLEKGSASNAARELGQGWKVNPFVRIKPGETFTMAEIAGPGIIRHIWMTPTGDYRLSVFRVYWDNEQEPSVEVPVGDFFASGWGWENEPQINSLAVCVNPKNGFNCYWQMPYRKGFRMTMENESGKDLIVYYQVDYAEVDPPAEAGYFHAQFRRVNPVASGDVYTIADGIRGKGAYVGTYIAHGANSPGWWGEGEVKFYIDGDDRFPTICGTGEEDYFNGSYGFEERTDSTGNYQYTDFSSPYSGFYQVRDPNNRTAQRRFGEYRWHITDPVRFDNDLRVTIQCLGWQSEGRYLPLRDDMASVAYWYQADPHAPFPSLPAREKLVLSWADPVPHAARGKAVRMEIAPSPKYASDPALLTDGILGGLRFNDDSWMGFEGTDMEATVDLGTHLPIKKVGTHFLSNQDAHIFLPLSVEILVSEDGKLFLPAMRSDGAVKQEYTPRIQTTSTTLDHITARYVRVKAENIKACPSWHTAAGGKAWIFVDEIIVE